MHSGFTKDEIKRLSNTDADRCHFSYLFALEHGTYLIARDKHTKEKIEKGSALFFFSHKLICTGCRYEKKNHRLFLKFGCEKKEFPYETPESEHDLGMANARYFCKKSHAKQKLSAFRFHAYQCNLNPKGGDNKKREARVGRKITRAKKLH